MDRSSDWASLGLSVVEVLEEIARHVVLQKRNSIYRHPIRSSWRSVCGLQAAQSFNGRRAATWQSHSLYKGSFGLHKYHWIDDCIDSSARIFGLAKHFSQWNPLCNRGRMVLECLIAGRYKVSGVDMTRSMKFLLSRLFACFRHESNSSARVETISLLSNGVLLPQKIVVQLSWIKMDSCGRWWNRNSKHEQEQK